MDTQNNIEPSKSNKNLLETIVAIRAGVGDGLNDNELTRLLSTALLMEAGFNFLSFSEGFVTLTVPQQEPANWYPKTGWILPEKERIARIIAEKNGLTLCEPPDDSARARSASSNSPGVHHHLEYSNGWETIIVAHPQYLKIRLFGATSRIGFARSEQSPLQLPANLLQELSALYQV
jgi:hypothetical protein